MAVPSGLIAFKKFVVPSLIVYKMLLGGSDPVPVVLVVEVVDVVEVVLVVDVVLVVEVVDVVLVVEVVLVVDVVADVLVVEVVDPPELLPPQPMITAKMLTQAIARIVLPPNFIS